MEISVFSFADYRKYLASWLDHAKKQKLATMSTLSTVAQVHTTFMSQVLKGGKQLSLEQAALLADYFKHTELEREYFFVLIQLDRAGNPSLRKYFEQKKSELNKQKNNMSRRMEGFKDLSHEDKTIYYSSWIYSALRTATDISNGQTLTQLSERFGISRQRCSNMMSFLVRCGLCEETKGVYKMRDQHVHIPSQSPLVTRHHSNWRLKALVDMDDRRSDELFFTAPMSISMSDFLKIRELLNVLIKKAIDVAKESKSEDVYCLNLDFFQPRGKPE